MEEKKNKKVYVVIITLLLLVIAILIGFVIFKINSKEPTVNNSNNNNNNNNEQNNISNDLNSEDIKQENMELAQNIFNKFIIQNDYMNMIKLNYSDDYRTLVAINNTPKKKIEKVSCKELFKNDDYKSDNYEFFSRKDDDSVTGACPYDIEPERELYEYNYEDVNSTYKKMFGQGDAQKNIVDLKLFYEGIPIYAYSTTQNSYIPLDCNCGGIGNMEYYHIYEGYTINNELHITFSFFAYISYDYPFEGTEERQLKAFTGFSNEKKVLNIKTNKDNDLEITNVDEIFTMQKNKFDLYELIFTNDENNYIFKSLTKIN